MISPKICLGSAQFGLDYGITNKTGKVEIEEIIKIIEIAQKENISLIDTAQGYGDCEYILGKCIKKPNNFKIISKFPSQNKNFFTEQDQIHWENNLNYSLNKLKVNQLEGLLLHNSNDLKKEGSQHLNNWLISIKERELTKNIGLSIYTKNDLKGINLDFINIVQLPLSIYDQRLINDGTISLLKRNKCSIYARSIFLQGLILTNSSKWPNWINRKNAAHQKNLELLSKEKNASLLDLAVGFIKIQQEIDAAVIGITSLNELKALLNSWRKISLWHKSKPSSWAIHDSYFLDPRNWP